MMKELSLNVLDIAQNSISAGATLVTVETVEDEAADRLTIRILDNGRGMTPEQVAHVTDPFFTTRTTRKVG
ncbi:MAG: ATP-binding protein, partial [Clostridiales bacterium]|nr:ATP-binding protein [Clostridiales bacterium]